MHKHWLLLLFVCVACSPPSTPGPEASTTDVPSNTENDGGGTEDVLDETAMDAESADSEPLDVQVIDVQVIDMQPAPQDVASEPATEASTRCRSNLGRDCPPGQACSASGQCTTACSFDWRCNGGCCNNGRCAVGTDLNACGTSSTTTWRCGDCARGCTTGAACRMVTGGGACACSSCTPIGGSCSTANQCCSRTCAGLGGNSTCQ